MLEDSTNEAIMSKCILVIEDQEDNRQILRDLLTSADFEVVEAEDGEAGLTAAATHRPDLILMEQVARHHGCESSRYGCEESVDAKHVARLRERKSRCGYFVSSSGAGFRAAATSASKDAQSSSVKCFTPGQAAWSDLPFRSLAATAANCDPVASIRPFRSRPRPT